MLVPASIRPAQVLAAVFVVLFPPADIPVSAGPRLFGRALVVTTYFVLAILAAQQGSPVVVQTCLAATPLIVLAWESWRARRRPPAATLAAAALVAAGVTISLWPLRSRPLPGPLPSATPQSSSSPRTSTIDRRSRRTISSISSSVTV